MRSNMSPNENARQAARQELLEYASTVMAASPCASMPETMFEMLEIIAMERRMTSNESEAGSNSSAPLTSKPIKTPIRQRLVKLVRSAFNVAGKREASTGTWQLRA